jgi:hypothetical protein
MKNLYELDPEIWKRAFNSPPFEAEFENSSPNWIGIPHPDHLPTNLSPSEKRIEVKRYEEQMKKFNSEMEEYGKLQAYIQKLIETKDYWHLQEACRDEERRGKTKGWAYPHVRLAWCYLKMKFEIAESPDLGRLVLKGISYLPKFKKRPGRKTQNETIELISQAMTWYCKDQSLRPNKMADKFIRLKKMKVKKSSLSRKLGRYWDKYSSKYILPPS